MARRIRRSTGPLDLRAQAILRAVIEEYVTTATPVGSQALVDRYRLGVSSATVRNILAELELAGLLDHPHTSAGRIPTDAGYRWYVESIIDAAPLPEVEQLMIRHQFGQVEFASEHWFRLAATTLASVTRAAGLATPAKPSAVHLRRLDLVSISDRLALPRLLLTKGVGSLKYIWSEQLPKGFEFERRKAVKVLESGAPASRDGWVGERVDIASDYQRRFGVQKLLNPIGISILTDADDTQTSAEGDYANFRLCRE